MISYLLCPVYSKATYKNKKKQYFCLTFNSGMCFFSNLLRMHTKATLEILKKFSFRISYGWDHHQRYENSRELCHLYCLHLWHKVNKKFCHRYAHLHIQDVFDMTVIWLHPELKVYCYIIICKKPVTMLSKVIHFFFFLICSKL